MVACCGEERATAFCPDCGKRLATDAKAGLAAHARKQIKALEGTLRRLKGGDRYYNRSIESTTESLAKWQSWLDWVLKQGE